MAYLKAAQILTRARELVEDGAGSYRAIATSRFTGDLHEGVAAQQATKLALLDAKPAEASITAVRPHPQRLSRVGSVNLKRFDLEVRVVRTIAIDGQVDDDTRDTLKALAAQDGDVLDQVLGWPPNLDQTVGGEDTDWIGAEYAGSAVRVQGEAGKAMRLDTIHRFDCTAVTRPTTGYALLTEAGGHLLTEASHFLLLE